MAELASFPRRHFHNEHGDPAMGWELHFFEQDSISRRDTYTNKEGSTTNTNPIILDSRGEFVAFLDPEIYVVELRRPGAMSAIWSENFNGTTGGIISQSAANLINNHSFEVDSGQDGIPDGWYIQTFDATSSYEKVKDVSSKGLFSLKFTSAEAGGGVAITSEAIEVAHLEEYFFQFDIKSSIATVKNMAEVLWYQEPNGNLYDTDLLYEEDTNNPLLFTKKEFRISPPAAASYAKIKLTGCSPSSTVAGSTWFDNIIFTNVLSDAVTTSPWVQVTGVVTWLSGTSFSIPSSALFELGRKVKVSQLVDALGSVESSDTAGGVTTVGLANIVEYDDPDVSATLTNPIASVAVSTVTVKSSPATAQAGGGAYSGLVISNNITVPNSRIDITAIAVTLMDTVGKKTETLNVAETVNITASGPGGLDTGSEAAATWYALYLISDGTITKGLLSTSFVAPTMPAGYTYRRRVGAVYNNSSANFPAFSQRGNTVDYVAFATALTGGTAAGFTALALFVPPTASHGLISQQGLPSPAADTSQQHYRYSLDGTSEYTYFFAAGNTINSSVQPLNPAGVFYWRRSSGAGSLYIHTLGYIDNL